MKRPIWIIIIAIILLLFVLAAARQIRKSHEPLPKSISELQQEQGIPVEVEKARLDTFRLSRNYLGNVEGAMQGDAVASIMEKIVEIPVKVGDRVHRGQVVAKLDTKAAQAQYTQAKLAYDDAQREVQRMENLFAAGAVSEQTLEKARLARDIAAQNLASSSELVWLTAPIDGVVTDVFHRVGETTEIGKPVVRIADLQRVRVKFKVNYDDRKKISEGTPVFIRVSGNGIIELPAKVVEISLSADPQSRLFNIWVSSENRENHLQPGLLVDVRVVAEQVPESIVINRDAILVRNNQPGVFIVDDSLRASFQPLQIGLENASEVQVLSGLRPGQTVVVVGQNNLESGKLVKIVNA